MVKYILTIALGALSVAQAQDTRQFTGKFEAELVDRGGLSPAPFSPAWPSDLRRLPAPLASGERAYVGSLIFRDYSDTLNKITKRIPAMVVVSPTAPTVLYASLSGDTLFTAKDRYQFSPRKAGVGKVKEGDMELRFLLPIPSGTAFKHYPVHLVESPETDKGILEFRKQTADDVYYLWEISQVAQGTVVVDGKPTIAQFSVSPITGKVLTVGNYSLDCDGDGKIDLRSKTENVYRRKAKDPVVFKAGNTYLEPASVDNEKGSFVLEERTADDYAFLDLSVDATIPDFSFVTLDGSTRKISDYRGKYLLIDVWSTGCPACVEEMPRLKAAYETYKPRGFEIVGLNQDEELASLNKYLKKMAITWPQTSTGTPVSGPKLQTLIEKQLRITGIPSVMLIGPDGKILSLGEAGQPRLRGDDLFQTLEKLMPLAIN